MEMNVFYASNKEDILSYLNCLPGYKNIKKNKGDNNNNYSLPNLQVPQPRNWMMNTSFCGTPLDNIMPIFLNQRQFTSFFLPHTYINYEVPCLSAEEKNKNKYVFHTIKLIIDFAYQLVKWKKEICLDTTLPPYLFTLLMTPDNAELSLLLIYFVHLFSMMSFQEVSIPDGTNARKRAELRPLLEQNFYKGLKANYHTVIISLVKNLQEVYALKLEELQELFNGSVLNKTLRHIWTDIKKEVIEFYIPKLNEEFQLGLINNSRDQEHLKNQLEKTFCFPDIWQELETYYSFSPSENKFVKNNKVIKGVQLYSLTPFEKDKLFACDLHNQNNCGEGGEEGECSFIQKTEQECYEAQELRYELKLKLLCMQQQDLDLSTYTPLPLSSFPFYSALCAPISPSDISPSSLISTTATRKRKSFSSPSMRKRFIMENNKKLLLKKQKKNDWEYSSSSSSSPSYNSESEYEEEEQEEGEDSYVPPPPIQVELIRNSSVNMLLELKENEMSSNSPISSEEEEEVASILNNLNKEPAYEEEEKVLNSGLSTLNLTLPNSNQIVNHLQSLSLERIQKKQTFVEIAFELMKENKEEEVEKYKVELLHILESTFHVIIQQTISFLTLKEYMNKLYEDKNLPASLKPWSWICLSKSLYLALHQIREEKELIKQNLTIRPMKVYQLYYSLEVELDARINSLEHFIQLIKNIYSEETGVYNL